MKLYGACLTAEEADALYRFLEDSANRPYWEGEEGPVLRLAHAKLSPRNRLDAPAVVDALCAIADAYEESFGDDGWVTADCTKLRDIAAGIRR